jgi:hypothetical protein
MRNQTLIFGIILHFAAQAVINFGDINGYQFLVGLVPVFVVSGWLIGLEIVRLHP